MFRVVSNRHDGEPSGTVKVVVTLSSGQSAVTYFQGSLVEAINVVTRWP